MANEPDLRATLSEAWDIAQSSASTYVVLAHAFACHGDGSDCDGGLTCRPDRKRLEMLDIALDCFDAGETFRDFELAYSQRAPS